MKRKNQVKTSNIPKIDALSGLFGAQAIFGIADQVLNAPKRMIQKKLYAKANKHRNIADKKASNTTNMSDSVIVDRGELDLQKAHDYEAKAAKFD